MPSGSCEWRLPRSERRWRGRIAINNRGLCTRNLVSMSTACILNVQDVVRAASIAMDYRLKFEKDIVVDMICFRRWWVAHVTFHQVPITWLCFSILIPKPSTKLLLLAKKKKMLKIISYVQWNTWHLVDLSRHGTFSLSACARCDNWVPRNLSGYS